MKFIGEEAVKSVKLDELYPFPDHPFQVRDDESMQETVESVKQYGVLSPILVREREEGGYEIISGHRRKRACELAGIEEVPVIVRNMDRDSAIIAMVDANIQREYILPSEKAAALKIKLEAIKRQGERNDLTSAQLVPKLTTREKIAEEAGMNRMDVSRFICQWGIFGLVKILDNNMTIRTQVSKNVKIPTWRAFVETPYRDLQLRKIAIF